MEKFYVVYFDEDYMEYRIIFKTKKEAEDFIKSCECDENKTDFNIEEKKFGEYI